MSGVGENGLLKDCADTGGHRGLQHFVPTFFGLTLDKANRSWIIADVFGVRRLWRRLREFKFNFGRWKNDGARAGVQRAFVNAGRRQDWPQTLTMLIGTAPKLAAFAFIMRILVEGLQPQKS